MHCPLTVTCRSHVVAMNRCFQVLLCWLTGCSLTVGLRAQGLVIDQSNSGPTHMYFSLLSLPIGQEFVPTFGSLNAVDLMTYGNLIDVTASFQVRIHSGSLSGSVVGVSDQAFRSDGTVALTHFSFPSEVSLTPG